MNLDSPSNPNPVLVACLCADWCGVCRDYRARFEQMQARFPDTQFLWIDVEDEADLLHPLDVEDFPTILLAVGDEARFFGTITPQPEMLERLVRSHTRAQHPPLCSQRGRESRGGQNPKPHGGPSHQKKGLILRPAL
ncbi:MAG: thioredoxin family protein [Rhodoferax sp.]|nr:thioredoxin family protein [Rhodoferax sp.]